jgi:MFS family permease
MAIEQTPSFDPKSFLAKVGDGRSIGKYRKDQIVFDRWGSRRLAVIGMILTGTGLAIASTARSLAEVYAAYGLGVGCSYVPAVGAVQRWFVRRRGFASGLAVSGIGVGTLVMPPLAAAFIAAFGWRDAYLVLVVSPPPRAPESPC